ncbi:biotin--[acetyl-CoA-carboxylase] ligase [Pedobacter sp. Leaf250]|uniref:biotin--[acetyl-CoA-carboxylase] ligase n=1 Tax=Pedobacter sp. Leaf250 TaxID=2876559 RepID=UPI001E390C08|nr:biotin--[acetyl-CoA-carboxylase] ligase [Pedobacter sp. Leaf250]
MQNNTFSTLFVGQNLIKLKEVDSTNNFLKELVSKSEPLPEGTVIMADNQFAGRGQQNSVWQSQVGKNISTSIYLKPSFLPLDKQFYLNMAVSLAICDTLSHFIPTGIKIKWPNDMHHFDKKLGGVLIENSLTGSRIKSSVIGIGLNINQTDFPKEIEHRATSVIQILQKEFQLEVIMEKLFVFMEKYYLILKSGKFSILKNYYLEKLYRLGESAYYKENGEVFEGVINGVDENGRLLVEVAGCQKSFNFKEIEFTHTK